MGSAGTYSIQETFDGGYVFLRSSIYNGSDVCIVKLILPAPLNEAKIYSGQNMEGANYIEQTPDSGLYGKMQFMISGVPFAKLASKT